jgi:O-antigen/teichoic acid export membrane protein
LISIIFSKSVLSIGEIGVYETFLLIAGGVSFFWVNGLIQSLMPLFKDNNSFKNKGNIKQPVLFNTFILMMIFSVLAGAFVWICNESIANILNLSSSTIPYLKILIGYIILSGPNNLIEYIYLLHNKSKQIIIYGIVCFSLQLLFLTVPVLLGYDLGYGLYGLLLVNVLKFVLLIFLLNKYSEIRISFQFLKEHLHFGLPLILSLLLSGSATYIDGLLVSNKFDEATFAIFRYGAKEIPFVILLSNAFSNAMLPEFSGRNNITPVLTSIRKKSLKLIHILFPVNIVLLLVSHWLYPLVFNSSFSASAGVFNVYLLIVVSRMVFPQTILVGLKKSKVVMYSSLIELIVNVGLSVLMISYWGIEGVAFATLIAYMLQKIIMMYYLSNKLNISPKQYIPVKAWLSWSSLSIVVYFISKFLI